VCMWVCVCVVTDRSARVAVFAGQGLQNAGVATHGPTAKAGVRMVAC
jgi:hypothetical protein